MAFVMTDVSEGVTFFGTTDLVHTDADIDPALFAGLLDALRTDPLPMEDSSSRGTKSGYRLLGWSAYKELRDNDRCLSGGWRIRKAGK